jgi:hypothetical protein
VTCDSIRQSLFMPKSVPRIHGIVFGIINGLLMGDCSNQFKNRELPWHNEWWNFFMNLFTIFGKWHLISLDGLDDRASIHSRGRHFFLLATASKPALGSTHPPIQWVTGALTPAVKRPGPETAHSPPSSAEVNAWNCISTSTDTSSWRGA